MSSSGNSGNPPPFDPHSAPTIMEQAPIEAIQAARAAAANNAAQRPRSIGEILGAAFELYKKHAVLFIITAAVAMVPIYLVMDGLLALFVGGANVAATTSGLEARQREVNELGEEIQRKQAEGASQEELQPLVARHTELQVEAGKAAGAAVGGMLAMLLALVGTMMIMIPLYFLAQYLTQAALVVVVADRAREGSLTWGAAWGVVMKRIVPLIGTSLLAAFFSFLGFFACGIGALVVAFFTALLGPVVLVEKRSGMDAIKRSFELVKSAWVNVLLVLLVFGVISFVVGAIAGLLIPNRFFFLDAFVSHLATIAVLPIPIIGLVLVYQDIVRSKAGGNAVLATQEEALLAEARPADAY